MRALSIICLCMFFYLNFVQSLAEEDGKRLIGWTASTAQIAGSLICPYLVVIFKNLALKHLYFSFVQYEHVA